MEEQAQAPAAPVDPAQPQAQPAADQAAQQPTPAEQPAQAEAASQDNAANQPPETPNTFVPHYQSIRSQFSDQIRTLKAIVDSRPDEGAEVMLALRHLQDARMRLGVAEALAKGIDPWTSQVPSQA